MPTPDLDELIETFEYLEDWDERYEYIIELGRKLPTLDAEFQVPENRVDGCMSTVWLVAQIREDSEKRLDISADSDSILVRGLIAILLAAYSGKPSSEIRSFDIQALFRQLGLNQHLSVSRRNGLFSMVKRILDLTGE